MARRAATGIAGSWADQTRQTLRQQHLETVVLWARTELQLDNAQALVVPLTQLFSLYPLVEPLAAALIRALQATGRGAEALDCYATVQKRLAEDLGTDPGSELQRLHQAILLGDPRRRTSTTVRPLPAVPAQLPLDVHGFTGRTHELTQLDAILDSRRRQPTTVVVSAIAGSAGVGKTALAGRWAQRVRDRFPDGQLYVNLRGFDLDGTVVNPADAIRRYEGRHRGTRPFRMVLIGPAGSGCAVVISATAYATVANLITHGAELSYPWMAAATGVFAGACAGALAGLVPCDRDGHQL